MMDGGSGLNIMYAETLATMKISRTQLRPSRAPFHSIIAGKRALPLGQIDLSVTFGDPSNFRMETLTFEVVRFRGTYHDVFGQPCYVKFMAIPNYIYLELKMRHYFESHPITIVSSCPLGKVIQIREATGRIAKWAVELMGDGITYAPRKAIKS
jgi:hypothetical protein